LIDYCYALSVVNSYMMKECPSEIIRNSYSYYCLVFKETATPLDARRVVAALQERGISDIY